MSKNILKATAVTFAVLVVIVWVALIAYRRPEEPEVETVPERAVGAHIVEEETTSEEETTVAAVTASAVKPVVTAETTEETTAEVPSYSVEEMADYVLNAGLNGDARKEALGENYEAVQKWLDENYVPPTREYVPDADPSYDDGGGDYFPTGGGLTPGAGVCYFDGHMETYYNLPMGGVLDIMYALGYSGEYWVRSDGVKMFGPYVMVAADFGWLPRGSVVECSLGTAIVCDTGAGGYGWLDVAVTW